MAVLLDCLDRCKSSKAKALGHSPKEQRISKSNGGFVELQDHDLLFGTEKQPAGCC